MRRWLLVLCGLLSMPLPAAGQDVDDYIRRGDASFHAGEYQAAERQFAEAARRFPDAPIPRLARGHTLFAMRRYRAASRSLQEGIDRLPQWSRSDINLRNFFPDRGEFDDNLANLRDAVDAAPEDRELVFLLAYCLHFSGHAAEARALFRYLLKLAPGHEAARTFLAVPDEKET